MKKVRRLLSLVASILIFMTVLSSPTWAQAPVEAKNTEETKDTKQVELSKAKESELSPELLIEKKGPRKSAFSIGLSGSRHSLKAGDGNEFIGNAAGIQLGSGYISENWFAMGSLDILLGPYEPTRNQQLDTDFIGTGLSLVAGFSAQTLNLRSAEGGYGFTLGLSYADTIGRSVGRNRRESAAGDPQNNTLIDNYIMHVNNLSIVPGIFFSWLKPARPRGNTPELLLTRLDGYVLMIGAAMPLISSYQARYETRDRTDPTTGQPIASQAIREKGRLGGYSVTICLTAILGI